MPILSECVTARRALEWPVVGVGAMVHFQTVHRGVAFVAEAALVQRLHVVDNHVPTAAMIIYESLPSVYKRTASLRCVDGHVNLSWVRMRKSYRTADIDTVFLQSAYARVVSMTLM